MVVSAFWGLELNVWMKELKRPTIAVWCEGDVAPKNLLRVMCHLVNRTRLGDKLFESGFFCSFFQILHRPSLVALWVHLKCVI
jgi:hypothetical protein